RGGVRGGVDDIAIAGVAAAVLGGGGRGGRGAGPAVGVPGLRRRGGGRRGALLRRLPGRAAGGGGRGLPAVRVAGGVVGGAGGGAPAGQGDGPLRRARPCRACRDAPRRLPGPAGARPARADRLPGRRRADHRGDLRRRGPGVERRGGGAGGGGGGREGV